MYFFIEGELNQPVSKSDFKECISYQERRDSAPIKIPLHSLVIGVPKKIFSRNCTPGRPLLTLCWFIRAVLKELMVLSP